MPSKTAVHTDKAPAPLPVFSQAVVHNGMIYCSGSVGADPATQKLLSGSVGGRTTQALKNLAAVLEAGGSSIKNILKINIFLTTMDNFAEMNKAYISFFQEGVRPTKSRTCVAVNQLPFGTDVEIECTAFVDNRQSKL